MQTETGSSVSQEAFESFELIDGSGDPSAPECACGDPGVDQEEGEMEEFAAVHLHRRQRRRWMSEQV